MSGNYIKLHRSMQKWGWYKDTPTKVVFLELLLRARYHPGEYMGYPLEIGQAVFGRKELAECLGLTERGVRTAIQHLIKTGEITAKSTNKFTVVTIENWGKYQCGDDDDRPTDDQQVTNNRPTSDQQVTTNKERKNVIKKEGKNNISNEIFGAEILDIVTYLNERLGTRYRASTKKTQDTIKARLNEGFTVDDFKVVIDKKADEWLGDPKMEKFLRPETLFSNKFEGYLNQPVTKKVNVFDIEF